MSQVNNIFFRHQQSNHDYSTKVGDIQEFWQNSQKSFKKCINWIVAGNQEDNEKPLFIGIKNIRRGGSLMFQGDIVGAVEGSWDEVNYLYTTYAGNGANSVPVDKGAEFAIELSRRLREQRAGSK